MFKELAMKLEDIKKVSVLGAGTMGNGIVHVFALAGYEVDMVDINEDYINKGLETIKKNMSRQVKKEVITQDQMDKALSLIKTSTSRDSVTTSDLVVEAVPENPDLKFDIFKELSEKTKDNCILATNTSTISITEIASHTKKPQNVIGMHFMNPVPMMKLIEVINGFLTDKDVFQLIMELSKKLGKEPTAVNDYPGFVSNRILMPMINEAVYCVMEGVATVESIDTVMRLGMAHPMGPLALADLIGLDTCLSIMEVLHEGLGDSKYRPCPLLRKMVNAGLLGKKTKRGFYNYEK